MSKTYRITPNRIKYYSDCFYSFLPKSFRADSKRICYDAMNLEDPSNIIAKVMHVHHEYSIITNFTKRKYHYNRKPDYNNFNGIIPEKYREISDFLRSFDKSMQFDYECSNEQTYQALYQQGWMYGRSALLTFCIDDCGIICVDLTDWWDKARRAYIRLKMPKNERQMTMFRSAVRQMVKERYRWECVEEYGRCMSVKDKKQHTSKMINKH